MLDKDVARAEFRLRRMPPEPLACVRMNFIRPLTERGAGSTSRSISFDAPIDQAMWWRQLFHFAGLTCDNARTANRLHDCLMQELIAKANQAILESRCLRREGRSLRFQASVLASELGQTIVRSRRTKREFTSLKTSFDQAFSDPADSIEFSGP